MLPPTNADLIQKYNQPVPRYTSYPTVPVWPDLIDLKQWKNEVAEQFNVHNSHTGMSLYVHLPFCESLCTYCGCNKKITTNHGVEEPYLKALEKEFALYTRLFNTKPVIRELHLGGGTPTFFAPKNLERLMRFLQKHTLFHADHEFSFEGHPNNTTQAHLSTLYNLGFRRVSYGVQDTDPEVQRIINRIQPMEKVQQATENARKTGFTSVNFDLIYGLPKQNLQRLRNTMSDVLALEPDRIAFYSYAHVPWTSKGQRLFDENDLPEPAAKLELYRTGKQILTEKGYTDIGMDHFALPGEALWLARQNGTLHRNFMGYTTRNTALLLGIGVSAISDTGSAFAQNRKSIHEYYQMLEEDSLPVFKGYFLNEEDRSFRNYIHDISCRGYTEFRKVDAALLSEFTFPVLQDLANDGLVVWNEREVRVSESGQHFIRNICAAFDLYLQRGKRLQQQKTLFSKAI